MFGIKRKGEILASILVSKFGIGDTVYRPITTAIRIEKIVAVRILDSQYLDTNKKVIKTRVIEYRTERSGSDWIHEDKLFGDLLDAKAFLYENIKVA